MDNVTGDHTIETVDILRFENKPRYFNIEIYILDKKNKKIFPLHPYSLESANRIIFPDIPSLEEWDEILRIYDHNREYMYCKYVERIIDKEPIQKSPELKNLILCGCGFSPARYSEVKYIAALSGNKLQLFNDKKIPAKYIRLLDSHDSVQVDKFLEILLSKEINGNTARDLLNMWVDLAPPAQEEALGKIQNIINTFHPDRRARIGEEFKKILFELRFPSYNKRLEEIENYSREFSKKVRVNFDPHLEKDYYELCVRIDTRKDIESTIGLFNDENTPRRLEKILDLIKK